MISYRVSHWLQYFHDIPTKVLNLGNTRRKMVGEKAHSFFDANNQKAQGILDNARKLCLAELRKFLQEDEEGKHVGRVAIYDAANITEGNRKQVIEVMKGVLPRSHIIFVEIIQTNKMKIDRHIRSVKIKVGMPDYKSEKDTEKAVVDYMLRVEHFQKIYVPLGKDKSLSYIKIVDDGRQVSMNKIKGFLPGRIVNYLMNLHTQPRPIYLSRHGESQYNVLKKIGGNSPLSPQGEKYAEALADWVKENVLQPAKPLTGNPMHARLYTSSLRRTKDTVRHFDHKVQEDGWVTMRRREWRALDEIFAGVFDGMTYQEIKRKAPQQFKLRSKNKLEYRYPRGESYMDVIKRVEQAVVSMEGLQDPVVVVAHQAVLRIVYAYFMMLDKSKAPTIPIPLNTVIMLVPRNKGCEEERFVLVNKENKENSNDAPSH